MSVAVNKVTVQNALTYFDSVQEPERRWPDRYTGPDEEAAISWLDRNTISMRFILMPIEKEFSIKSTRNQTAAVYQVTLTICHSFVLVLHHLRITTEYEYILSHLPSVQCTWTFLWLEQAGWNAAPGTRNERESYTVTHGSFILYFYVLLLI